jgi:hypothetical protein
LVTNPCVISFRRESWMPGHEIRKASSSHWPRRPAGAASTLRWTSGPRAPAGLRELVLQEDVRRRALAQPSPSSSSPVARWPFPCRYPREGVVRSGRFLLRGIGPGRATAPAGNAHEAWGIERTRGIMSHRKAGQAVPRVTVGMNASSCSEPGEENSLMSTITTRDGRPEVSVAAWSSSDGHPGLTDLGF